MGLLDDAIREHLELKRRGGADPQEIEKLEREALGPVRRSPQEAFDAPAVAEAAPEPLDLDDDYDDESWAEPEDVGEAAGHRHELAEADQLEEWDVPERGPIEGGFGSEPDEPGPAPPPPPTPAEPGSAAGSLVDEDYLEQETVEHDVEHEAGPTGEEDMLEETPEFLQDTPDHDRLWFEQRPPRDFDLDG
jgi:hypothetical protein